MQLGNPGLCHQWTKSRVLTDEMEWGSKFYVPDAWGAGKRAKQHLNYGRIAPFSSILMFPKWCMTLVEEV